MDSKVESDWRYCYSNPCLPLPLVEPDVQISPIRLSCKHFVMGDRVLVPGDTGSGSHLWGGGITLTASV